MSTLATAPTNTPARVMVCGPKATGKSTLARLIANRLLTTNSSSPARPDTVFVLDLDPGQPEYSPPGHVSLVQLRQPTFGPPFTHPITDVSSPVRTIRAHALGATSPKEDPDHFLRCALDLMTRFEGMQEQFPRSPLVVNTPGWVIGTGADILVQLIHNLALTEILYTKDDERPQTTKTLIQAAGGKLIRFLSSQQSAAVAPRSAAELRDMQTLSYFHQGPLREGHLHWDASPLTFQKPYIVGYGEDNAAILGVMMYGDWPGEAYLSTLLDGSLVSISVLEGIESHYVSADSPARQPAVARSNESGIPYIPPTPGKGFVEPLDPTASHTIGQALIRGIDAATKTFHILTPIPSSTLAELDPAKTVLIRGAGAAPGWAYMEETAWRNFRDDGALASRGSERDSGSTERQPWLQEIGPGGRGAGAAPLRTRRFRGVERG